MHYSYKLYGNKLLNWSGLVEKLVRLLGWSGLVQKYANFSAGLTSLSERNIFDPSPTSLDVG